MFANHTEKVEALRHRFFSSSFIFLFAALLVDMLALLIFPQSLVVRVATKGLIVAACAILVYLNSTKDSWLMCLLWVANLVMHLVGLLYLLLHFSFYISLGVTIGTFILILAIGLYVLIDALR